MRYLACLLLLALGCGPTPPVRTALRGDLATLRRDIARAQAEHTLSDSRVAELAQAVLAREIASAQGAAGAARVRALRACDAALADTLAQRARSEDEVAAEATSALLELHRVHADTLIECYGKASDPAWRALAARAASRAEDSPLRAGFFTDPDQRVRRGALLSAVAARRPNELEPLLEAARSDPEPVNRSVAARAVGAIGSERAVLGLKDLWVRADTTLRLAIVDAWAEPASLAAGGLRELELAADANASLASISAAYELTRAGGGEAPGGVARLTRALGPGVADERRLALTLVPVTSDSLRAIRELAHGDDLALAVAAHGKLLGVPGERAAALTALRRIAASKASSPSMQRAVDDARSLLAQAGEQALRPSFVAELSGATPEIRRRAASALIHLSQLADAATALADADPDVRTSVACEIVTRSRSH